MGARHWQISHVLAMALLLTTTHASADWVCHAGDGRTWVQQGPPCVWPKDPNEISPSPAREVRPSRPDRTSRPAPIQIQNVPPTPRPGAEATYAQTVAELEAKFPRVNPDSPAYDRASVAQVLELKRVYLTQGLSDESALRRAANDILAAPQPVASRVSSEQSAPTAGVPKRSMSGADAVINAGVKGLANGLVFALLVPLWLLVRWLWRQSRAVASQAAYVAGNTSANDIARAAGSASAHVERRTASFMDAFRQGRRDAAKRGE